MGWRIRKSINVGLGFRINLSKSGIGYSWGFPGYRTTKMANGGNRVTYSLPGTGISYVEQNGKNTNRSDMLYTGNTEVYKNIPNDEMKNNDPILKKINKVLLLNRLSNFSLLITLLIFFHPVFSLFFVLGIILKIYIFFSKNIGLFYEFDDETRKMYNSLKNVLIKMSNSKKMWQVTSSTRVYNKKYNAGAAHNISRNNAFITSKMPWYIKTNVDVYGLNLKRQKLFFTPDRIIVFRPFRKAFGCAYNDMRMAISHSNYIEDGKVYNDSTVIKYNWKYANEGGGRDLRFSKNKQYPVCQYGEFQLESQYGINTVVQFSNYNLAREIQMDLLSFGNIFNKLIDTRKNNDSLKDVLEEVKTEEIKETKSKLEEPLIVSSIEELKRMEKEVKEENIERILNDEHVEESNYKEELEYELPSIDIIKDDESKQFVELVKEMKHYKDVCIPIGFQNDEKIVEKLGLLPNLLIGGTVMAGKTTFINTALSGILMTKKPNDIKFVIFDSKRIDYSIYNDVPHMLMPVINDSKKLKVALEKMEDEITRRMDALRKANVKTVSQYNNIENISKMPDILIIIDDLTNLIDLEDINDSIESISLNGWNVNVYMIISANHPSARVLSTISKSNFPSRLSFKVTNTQASQNIINEPGAEKLTGVGNALFLSRMNDKPIKVVVPYITDNDIENIVDYTIKQQKAQYDSKYMNLAKNKKEEEYDDPLYDEIVEYVITSGKASASLLQRRFKLGYNRACRIVDLLEEKGIIGPQNGSKPREVLVKMEDNE